MPRKRGIVQPVVDMLEVRGLASMHMEWSDDLTARLLNRAPHCQ
jgi:hypothetical protein